MHTTALAGFSFSHDDKSILYTSDKTGIQNAYSVPVEGGKSSQLTYSTTESVQALSYFPNDNRILFTRDYGNCENTHLCVLEAYRNEVVLTPGERVQANFWGWSADESSFYCSTNERDARYFDLYKIDSTNYARTLLYRDSTGYQFCSISRDERYVLLLKIHSRANSDLYVYNRMTQENRCITPHSGNAIHCLGSFDVNSRYVYYSTDRNSEFRYIEVYDLATGKTECVERASGDVTCMVFSTNGKYRMVLNGGAEDGKIKIYNNQAGRIHLPTFRNASIKSAVVSRSEELLALYIGGDRAPNDLYVYNFEMRRMSKLVGSLNPEVDSDDLVESETVTFKSFDGLEIPCLLWKPHNASSYKKVPALVWAHGGPNGRIVKGYKGRIQYLVNHGYAVLGVNYRGSSGFGKTFLAADDRKHGREPVWDCVEAKRYLASLEYVDATRIGIAGASFGGYMVLAALAFCPEQFAVGIDICGISNWLTMLESLPPYGYASRNLFYEKIGDPRRDEPLLRAISPFFHVDRITKPLMILQGANDPRVPRDQSDAIVAGIRRNGGQVEYLVFEDEAHGFRKRANAIQAYEAILHFLDRHLKVSTH
jgi:protease II